MIYIRRRMGRKKKKSNKYWTQITECAVSAYNLSEPEPVLRERIYRRFLFPAFYEIG